jgi:DNA-binding GntR family transcriptional regulator
VSRPAAKRTASRPAATPSVFNLTPPAAHVPPERDGKPPRSRIETTWTARHATPAQADLLGLTPGALVFHIIRTVTAADGTVIKATTTLCPADRTVLHHAYPIPNR